MIYFSKTFIPFIVIGLLFVPAYLFASTDIVISEIMYDVAGTDTNREWVEIHNTGLSSVDLSSWKFFEANSNHSLVVHTGSFVIPAGGYSVIVDSPDDFLADWADYSGTILDSSWSSLSNSGESIALKNGEGVIVYEITYDPLIGAGGDGKSLQLIDGVWTAGTPTPGEENRVTQETENIDDNENSSPVTNNIIASETSNIELEPHITFESPVRIPAGVWFDIDPTVYNSDGDKMFTGIFVWNMGDGNTREDQYQKKVSYMYSYPGTYVVTLDYYRYAFERINKPYASNRIIIQVLQPGIEISSIERKDSSVSIKNTLSYEVDLGGWVVRLDDNIFRFPQHTIVLSGKTITLSSGITQFVIKDNSTIKIETPSGSVADILSLAPEKPKAKTSPLSKIETPKQDVVVDQKVQSSIEEEVSPSDEELTSSVINSLTDEDSSSNERGVGGYIWFLLFGLVVIGGAISVVMFTSKKPQDITEVSEADEYTFIE